MIFYLTSWYILVRPMMTSFSKYALLYIQMMVFALAKKHSLKNILAYDGGLYQMTSWTSSCRKSAGEIFEKISLLWKNKMKFFIYQTSSFRRRWIRFYVDRWTKQLPFGDYRIYRIFRSRRSNGWKLKWGWCRHGIFAREIQRLVQNAWRWSFSVLWLKEYMREKK